MPSPSDRNAFTLIEILIALAVTVILVFVTSSSLITVLRAEQSGARLRTGTRLVQSLAAEQWLGHEAGDGYLEETFPGWNRTAIEDNELVGDRTVAWTVWELAPSERPSLRISIAFRSPETGETTGLP